MQKSLLNRLERLEEKVAPEKPIVIRVPAWVKRLTAEGYTPPSPPKASIEVEPEEVKEICPYCGLGNLQRLYTKSGKPVSQQCSNPACLGLQQ
jgi:hypothetical protein